MSPHDLEVLFERIDDHDADLTEWELDFVDSTYKQYFSSGQLTDAQIEKLEDILEQLDERAGL